MTSLLTKVLCLCLATVLLLSLGGCADFFTRPDESGPASIPPPDPTPPSPADPPHPQPW